MRRKYKHIITPKLLKKLRLYWQRLLVLENKHHKSVYQLEKKMEKETGIEGIEFFYNDGYVGIGNFGLWTIPLVDAEKLED